MRQELFIKKFSKAIQEGNAAVFAGAGTSVDAGFVNWKNLVAPFANEIDINKKKETDLVGLTQQYVKKKRTRGQVNQEIID